MKLFLIKKASPLTEFFAAQLRRWRLSVLGLAAAAALGACSFADGVVGAEPSTDTTTIYLVRHAEKMSDGRDPALTEIGHERARRLATLLENTAVHGIWSSNYQRTRSTVEPLAKQSRIPVTLYDAGNSAALVEQLLSATSAGEPGLTHVVAGHSNTVPELVDLLESWPESVRADHRRPHLDHKEYGLLFVVTYAPGQKTTVEIRRY